MKLPEHFLPTVALLISVPQFVLASSTSSTTSSVAPSSVQPAHDTVQQLQSNLSSSPLDSMILCADGKGPLLEGEERIFPCAGQCPAGFECEFVKGLIEGGICCPNLGELYRHVSLLIILFFEHKLGFTMRKQVVRKWQIKKVPNRPRRRQPSWMATSKTKA